MAGPAPTTLSNSKDRSAGPVHSSGGLFRPPQSEIGEGYKRASNDNNDFNSLPPAVAFRGVNLIDQVAGQETKGMLVRVVEQNNLRRGERVNQFIGHWIREAATGADLPPVHQRQHLRQSLRMWKRPVTLGCTAEERLLIARQRGPPGQKFLSYRPA